MADSPGPAPHATALPQPDAALAHVRLHVVTGKGGTGKTTVAAALAVALARRGRKVLLVEVEGRQGIAQTFDVPPLATDEVRILADRSGGEIWGLSVEAKAALLEYLAIFYKLGRAGSALERLGAIDFATTIAPGVRDVLLTGKVYEAVGRRTGGRASGGRSRGGSFVYDAVVLDAPPTGRVVRFLNVNTEVADIAKVGPIRGQADSITRMLRSPVTAVHVVTLLEEMPVQESLDAVLELRRAAFPLGWLVVNMVHEPVLEDDDLAAATAPRARKVPAGIAEDLSSVGVKVTDAMVAGLVEEGREHRERVALQREQEAELEATGLPVVHLPLVADGLEGGGLRELAERLTAEGMA